jgi:hypothetical protein
MSSSGKAVLHGVKGNNEVCRRYCPFQPHSVCHRSRSFGGDMPSFAKVGSYPSDEWAGRGGSSTLRVTRKSWSDRVAGKSNPGKSTQALRVQALYCFSLPNGILPQPLSGYSNYTVHEKVTSWGTKPSRIMHKFASSSISLGQRNGNFIHSCTLLHLDTQELHQQPRHTTPPLRNSKNTHDKEENRKKTYHHKKLPSDQHTGR